MKEIIKIVQHESGLFVDSQGRIFKEVQTSERGKGKGLRIPYKAVSYKGQTYDCHRLVAQTYIPNPEDKPCVLHKDDNPQNNDINNLRWGTHADNMTDAKKRGRFQDSTPKQLNKYETVFKLLSSGHTQRQIGYILGVTESRISQMVKELIKWRWIEKERNK